MDGDSDDNRSKRSDRSLAATPLEIARSDRSLRATNKEEKKKTSATVKTSVHALQQQAIQKRFRR